MQNVRIKALDGSLDIEMVHPGKMAASNRDLAALQRETRWKLSEIQELAQLEGPSMALALFLSYRATGRLISYAKAEELLDTVEWVPEPGDTPDPEEEVDPTSAPTGSVRGDEPAVEGEEPTPSPV